MFDDYIDPDEFYDAQPERVPDAYVLRQPLDKLIYREERMQARHPSEMGASKMRDAIRAGFEVGKAKRVGALGPAPDIAAAYAEFAASGRTITKLPPARAEGAIKVGGIDGGLLMPSIL